MQTPQGQRGAPRPATTSGRIGARSGPSQPRAGHHGLRPGDEEGAPQAVDPLTDARPGGPGPLATARAEQQAGRLRFAGRALYRAAQDGRVVTGREGPEAAATDLRAMLAVAQSALAAGLRAPVFTSRNPAAAEVIPKVAAAWETGYDGAQDLVDQVDNKGAALTTPAEPGHQFLVQPSPSVKGSSLPSAAARGATRSSSSPIRRSCRHACS